MISSNETLVLAVSGGVDSVALLDMLARQGQSIVVAHFDHGIRPESSADARFVEGLAANYGLKFETRREELGRNASEAMARERRYLFLLEVAKKHRAKLVTAHHADDAVETVAINAMRGTGWRGLAAMDSQRVERPLLGLSKTDIYTYALDNQLEWVEDETNLQTVYLRNKLRAKLANLGQPDRQHLNELREKQVALKHQIDTEIKQLLQARVDDWRYFFTMVDDKSADELLRRLLIDRAGTPLTRPQRQRLLMAIKTALPGTVMEAGEGVKVSFSRRDITIKT